jgi:hypothetical protein
MSKSLRYPGIRSLYSAHALSLLLPPSSLGAPAGEVDAEVGAEDHLEDHAGPGDLHRAPRVRKGSCRTVQRHARGKELKESWRGMEKERNRKEKKV